MVRQMNMAVAKATTGANADGPKKVEKKELSDEDRAKREEFELNEEKVSSLELASWYGYDWANSVYSSVVIGIFLPVILVWLAEDYACPFLYLPLTNTIDFDDPDPDLEYYSKWDGFKNSTTTCTFNDDISLQAFGSPDNGFDNWPIYMQVYFDSSLDKFYVDEAPFKKEINESEYNCSDTGKLDFGLVRNATIFGTSCKEEKGDLADDCGMEENGSFGDAQAGFFTYTLRVADNSSWDGGDYVLTLTDSSNPYILNGTLGQRTDENPDGNYEYETNEDGDIEITVYPAIYHLGAATLDFDITSKSGDPDMKASVAFTLVRIYYRNCPFRIPYMGGMIRPITFSTFTLSISVVGQAIIFITVAAFGDFGPFRKLLLCYFSLIGSVCTMAVFMCDTPDTYIMAGFLTIFSNIFFGASHVLYSAYLPYLSRSHPIFLEAKFEYKNIKTGAATGVGAASKKLLDSYHDCQDMISAHGYMWGYISGSLCCFASIGIIMMVPDKRFGLRLIIFLMGLWWFVFALPLFFFVKTRPGPNFPDDLRKSFFHMLSFSWRRIIASGYSIRHLPETQKFVGAYFFFSDGYNTIAAVAVLFAMDRLGMTMTELTIIAAEAPLFGAVGMKIARMRQVKYASTAKQMLVLSLCILTFIPCYGFFGFLKDTGIWKECPIGLVQKTEMYFLAIVFGSVLGPVQSYARTFFTDLIPPGQEAEYFGVFEISDRGSSWMGPLICGGLYELTGSMRHAMFYLLFVNSVGLYLVLKTDPVKGSDDCRRKEIMVRMAADRKSFGIEKSGAPPSARKMAGLKSSAKTGMSSTGSSVASSSSSISSRSSGSSVEQPSFKVVGKGNKVAPDNTGMKGFGGATVVEGDDDEGGGFSNQTVVETDDDDQGGGGGFSNQTVIEDQDDEVGNPDDGGYGNQTVVENTD